MLIVGAGKIGAFFDTPESSAVLTHAHAFSSHPGFRLLGFVDENRQQSQEAARLWGGVAFASLAKALATQKVDVAVVAVSDEFHHRVLCELAAWPLRLVFAEKPLATTLEDAQAVVALYRERGIALAVNYSRRYVPEFQEFARKIDAGEFGRFLAGSGYYGKGTKHNGSHLVDLLLRLLGEPATTRTFASVSDWREDDPTCSAVVDYASGASFVMHGIDCRLYTVFELDLFFEAGRVRVVDSGFSLEIFELADSGTFAGYRVLAAGRTVPTALHRALSGAADGIHRHLTKGAALCCTGEDGVRALALCQQIIRGAS